MKNNILNYINSVIRNVNDDNVKNRFYKIRPLIDHCYTSRNKVSTIANKLYSGDQSANGLINIIGGFDRQKVVDMLFIVLARAVVNERLARSVGVEDWHYYWLRDAIRDAGTGDETLPLCLTRGDVAVFLYLLLGLARIATRGREGRDEGGGENTGVTGERETQPGR